MIFGGSRINGGIDGYQGQGMGSLRNDDFTAGDEQRHQSGIGNHAHRKRRIGIVFSDIPAAIGLERAQLDFLAAMLEITGRQDEFATSAAESRLLDVDHLADRFAAFGNDDLSGNEQIIGQDKPDLGAFLRRFGRYLAGELQKQRCFGRDYQS